MKFKLVINKDAEEEITAVVHERTEMIDAIEHLVIHEGNLEELYGYDKDTTLTFPVFITKSFLQAALRRSF